MKTILLITLVSLFFSCSNDDKEIEYITSIKYEVKYINNIKTNIKRNTTQTQCGIITESGTEELPGVNAAYYWITVCE
jgi:hypothetical protein